MKHRYKLIYLFLLLTVLPAKAGGYHPSEISITAGALEGVVERIFYLSLFGKKTPIEVAPLCRFYIIKNLKTIKDVSIESKRCRLIQSDIKDNYIYIYTSNINGCLNMRQLLENTINELNLNNIAMSNSDYENVGLKARGPITYLLFDYLDFDIINERSIQNTEIYKRMKMVRFLNIKDVNEVCKSQFLFVG